MLCGAELMIDATHNTRQIRVIVIDVGIYYNGNVDKHKDSTAAW